MLDESAKAKGAAALAEYREKLKSGGDYPYKISQSRRESNSQP